MSFCMNCGKELPAEAGFCPKCGTKVQVPACPKCGKVVDLDDAFCLYCGAPLVSEPEPVSEPISEPGPVPAPKPAFEPEPEPAVKRVEQVPEVCPRCGKPGVKGYGHCVYCGTQWKTLKVPEVCPVCGTPSEDGCDHCLNCGEVWKLEEQLQPKKSEAVPARPQGQQSAPASEGGPPRDFSWNYRRAMMRWNMHMAIHAEVDENHLRCTSTSRILGQTDVAEEVLPLESISKIILGARASFMVWTVVSLMLAVFAAMFALPSFGVQLAISGDELVMAAFFLVGLCALTIWWVRFNLYHYRMTIVGMGENGQKEIVLEAKKRDELQQLQVELTRQTGVRPSGPENDNASAKAFAGVLIGVCLAIGLAMLVADQAPKTAQGASSAKHTSPSPTTSYTRPTPIPASTPMPIQTPAPTPEQQRVSWSNYIGSWSCDDKMYGLEITCPPGSSVGSCTFMQILVVDGMPGMENTSFAVTLQEDGCLSGGDSGSDPALWIELYYDGYGLSGWVYNCMGEQDDYSECYFTP